MTPTLRLDLPLELAFDGFEVGADRFEHLNQIDTGFRRGVGQARQSDHIGAGVSTREAALTLADAELYGRSRRLVGSRRSERQGVRRDGCAKSASKFSTSASPARRGRCRAARRASRAPGRHRPARCACRDTAPAPGTGCRFRSAGGRSARRAPRRAAASAFGNVTMPGNRDDGSRSPARAPRRGGVAGKAVEHAAQPPAAIPRR